MGQACCSCHDKKTEQVIVTTPTAKWIDQPILPDSALIVNPYPDVSGDYVVLQNYDSLVDVIHISSCNDGGSWVGLGVLGSKDFLWEGRNIQSGGYLWHYQENGEFLNNEWGLRMRSVSAHRSQFLEASQAAEQFGRSSSEARHSLKLDPRRRLSSEARDSINLTTEPLGSNPYMRTIASPLYAALASGSVRLVRGCFLKNCWEKRLPWPMRQNMPESGFWPTADACEMWHMYGPAFFLALSYAWLHPRLNDPGMWHLERVARIVDEFHACALGRFFWFRQKGIIDPSAPGPPEDFGCFIDFCSLPQEDAVLGIMRSTEEHQQFVTGLGVADVIYGHVATTVVRITCVPQSESRKYDLRGWTSFEENVSNSKPGYDFRVFTFDDTFSPDENASHGIAMLSNYTKGQTPPRTPQQFKSDLQRRRQTLQQSLLKQTLFYNPADEAFVMDKYSEVWASICECESLAYRSASWGKTEGLHLASILPEFSRLKSLVLTRSAIGSDGLLAIFQRVSPTIEELTISESAGGDTVAGVAAELPRLTNLHQLDLSECDFGDDGVAAMAHQMPCSLRILELRRCGFKDRGSAAIAMLLSQLRKLFVSFNDLSGKGADAIVEALPSSPIEIFWASCTNLTDDEKMRFRCAWTAARKPEHALKVDGVSYLQINRDLDDPATTNFTKHWTRAYI